MPRRRRHVLPHAGRALDNFKYEVSRDLGLDGDIRRRGWGNMTTREAGRVGGTMVRRMIERAERDMAGEEYGAEWAAWPGYPEFTRHERSYDRPGYTGRDPYGQRSNPGRRNR